MIDFPFGQPSTLVQELGWPEDWAGYVAHVADLGIAGFEAILRSYKDSKPDGEKELYRATDRDASSRSPMKLENPPVGKMFLQGATRLWRSGVSVWPVRPVASETRVVVEAYPTLVARKWIGKKQGYKNDLARKCDEYMRFARYDIVHAIRGLPKNDCRKSVQEQYGLVVEMSDVDAAACVDDYSGDQLDSVLCAVQAAWVWSTGAVNESLGGAKVMEGCIVDPSVEVR